MKKLKLLLLSCVVAIAANAGTKTVYLAPGPWNANDATERYALYMFDDGAGTHDWTNFTEGDNGIWSAAFNDTYPNMIICRIDAANETNAWNNEGGSVWNQTANLDAPFADGLTYTITATGDSPTYYISAYLYNPTTGLFLSRGARYGTAVWGDNFGIPVIFIANNGGYRLQWIDQTDQYVSDQYWSWADGGTDRAQTYNVSAVEGGYKLINQAHGDQNKTLYIAEGGDGEGFTHQIASNGKYGENCNENWDVWQFKSSAQREEIAANRKATAEATMATSIGYTLTGSQTLKELVEDVNTFAASNKTSSITNATLTGDYSTGWSYTKKNNGSNPTNNNADGVEVYQGCGTFSQTIEGLDNGLYKVTLNGFYRDGWNPRCSELSNNGWKLSNAYLEANGNQTMIADWASDRANDGNPNGTGEAKALINSGKYLNEVYALVTDGTLTISIAQPGGATAGRWFFFTNATLTYYSDAVSDDDATTILATADEIDGEIMQGSLQTALTSATTAFDDSRTIANYNALETAINNAQNSIAAYANAKAYLDEAPTLLEGTNVYTAAAYATYYTEPKAKYDARTLTTDEANALVKTSTGWHSANTIDDILLSAWTIGGEQCSNFDKSLYINTWSTEGASDGSDFLAPFFEYFVSDANSLGATNIVATVSGLKASTTYTFAIRARVRQTDGQTKIANGITMKVGEGEATDISAGTIFNSGPFYIGNFSAVGETDAEGKLTCTITVAENSNISWLSFYNAKYTEGIDLSSYIADYEFALDIATANRDNASYAAITGKEKIDLVAAITTYADVDNEDKDALIEAKEALETASAAFVAAAYTYTTFAELNTTVAATLGVDLPTITSSTTAADLEIESYIVAEHTAAKANYAEDYTARLGEWTNAPGTNKGESWDGTTGNESDTYYDLYNAADRAMTQTVMLPKGDYALIAKGRASTNGLLTVTVGTETVTFPHKSSTGRGIATNGTATFAPEATYANSNNGRGWEYRVITFTSDGLNATTLTFDWKTASSNWCGLDDIELLCNPVDPIYAVVGSKKGDDSDEVIFSSGWDQETMTDILTEESEGVYSKTYTNQTLDAQTIAYKVIKKDYVAAISTIAWYGDGENNKEIDIPVKGIYNITFTFTEDGYVVAATATKVKEAVTIGSAGWATTVTNSALDFSAAEIEAYTATVADNTVTLTKVDDVQVETGLVLKGTAGTYYVPVAESSSTDKGSLSGNSLEGFTIYSHYADFYYGLKVTDGMAKFAQIQKPTGDDTFTIPAGKAFLIIHGDYARELSVVFEGETTTGISTMKNEGAMNNAIYDLQGRKVNSQLKSGLYIMNGKKVVKK